MSDSKIVCDADGRALAFVGEDATRLFAVATLRVALGLLAVGIQPTRGYTMSKGLSAATLYTGKKYGRRDVEAAREDLRVWIANMKSALPTEVR